MPSFKEHEIPRTPKDVPNYFEKSPNLSMDTVGIEINEALAELKKVTDKEAVEEIMDTLGEALRKMRFLIQKAKEATQGTPK